MSTYEEVLRRLSSAIGHTNYYTCMNDFNSFNTEDYYSLQKDTFIVDFRLYSTKETMEKFNNELNTNNLYDGDFPSKTNTTYIDFIHEYKYRIMLPAKKLIKTMNVISAYRVIFEVIDYYSMSYNTYTKYRQHILENFHLNTDDLLGRSYGPQLNNLDNSSFYVAIVTTIAIEYSDINKTIEDLLGDHCEGFIPEGYPSTHSLLLAKNIDNKFMAKFNLVKDALGVDIGFVVPGNDYLKQFED